MDTSLEHRVPSDCDISVTPESGQQASKWEESLSGQLPSFHVESSEIQIGSMPVDLLIFDATDVEFNVREMLKGEPAKVQSFGKAEVVLRISASALKSQLVPLFEKKGLTDVKIDFESNSAKVTAKRKVKLIGKVKLSAKAGFYVVGDSGIRLKVTEVETGQLNLGISKLNIDFDETVPPLDLGGMFAKVVIDQLELTSGFLHVTAHAVELVEDTPPKNAIEVL